jgi:hypothetical protein
MGHDIEEAEDLLADAELYQEFAANPHWSSTARSQLAYGPVLVRVKSQRT